MWRAAGDVASSIEEVVQKMYFGALRGLLKLGALAIATGCSSGSGDDPRIVLTPFAPIDPTDVLTAALRAKGSRQVRRFHGTLAPQRRD